ncbi:MAG: hypothetical protein OH338_00885 [Candidatus Parvarchaeota archaeon]|nr:hypothetical protein [Candidatus Parvarchaeum tengchongense]MCW1299270.1 hypothetical protein [Candidatus Parvarchaeum tengchongense]MCW1311969.1 hypothetical protein [Candidatus Parvarchaeum tengchongense]
MEQRLNDLLMNADESAIKELDKPLYDLLLTAAKRSGNGSVNINRRYAKFSMGNSVKYCINPKYFENYNKLRRVVYSIIKSAFRDYNQGGKENIEILLNYGYQADKVNEVKNELEESYGFRGTEAGFYEVPVLGEALEFSMKNMSVKALASSAVKEYI